MRLALEKLRTQKHYRIGYIPLIDEYVLAISCLTDEQQIYDNYYRITADTYELHKGELKRLDMIAETLMQAGVSSDDFIFSDNEAFNSTMQKEIYFECRDSQKERVNGTFERI